MMLSCHCQLTKIATLFLVVEFHDELCLGLCGHIGKQARQTYTAAEWRQHVLYTLKGRQHIRMMKNNILFLLYDTIILFSYTHFTGLF